MFRRVRALIAKGNAVADNANLTLELAKALIADFQDGFGITCNVDEGAAKKLAMLFIGKAGTIPLTVAIDPEWDKHPHAVSKCVGGPYDGKTFKIPPEDIEDGDMTLQGGARYKWDGKVFQFQFMEE